MAMVMVLPVCCLVCGGKKAVVGQSARDGGAGRSDHPATGSLVEYS